MLSENKIFVEEEKYLEEVNEKISKEIEFIKKEMQEIPKRYTNVLQGDSFLVESLLSFNAERLYKLEKISNSPYFGKISFTDDKYNDNNTVYIGRTFVSEDNGKNKVTDWRAPICSLYYDSEIGKTEFIAPSGKITGTLDLKRQFIIDGKKLEQVLDSSLVTSDEILRQYLNTHANDKMKDIVASIQKEQNEIIRKPLGTNLIVQGIAGSGKTSVALHRIAYLMYLVNENNSNIKDRVKADQFLIIGPNAFFLDYISEVLPDMDVENAKQSTMVSLARELLGNKIKIIDNNSLLTKNIINNKITYNNNNIKNSSYYIESLKKFLVDYIIDNLEKSFVIDGETIINGNSIRNRFNDLYYIQDNILNYIDIFSKQIKENHEHYESIINSGLRKKMSYFPQGSIEKKLIFDKIKENSMLVKKGLKNELKGHFAPILQSPINIYKEFIKNIGRYMDVIDLDSFINENLKMLNKNIVTRDDLVALMFIKAVMTKTVDYSKIVHVVVDEAQDLSMNEFVMLKELFPKATFSIFGDLNQTIFPYRSINDWDSLGYNIFANDYELKHLNQSYRTTHEIITEANKISKKLTGDESIDNVRHGSDVNYLYSSKDNLLTNLFLSIKNMQDTGCQSIAIITKTDDEASTLFKKLSGLKLNVNLITGFDSKYEGGLCVLSSYLAKGLEFDGVILYNANSENYNSNDKLDMSLLYVGMTRSLHNLDVLYEGELPDILVTNKIKKKEMI